MPSTAAVSQARRLHANFDSLRLQPSLTLVWLAAPIALALFAAGLFQAEPIDIWWCLLLGSAPPGSPDPVVFTPLAPLDANAQWLAQRWLAQLFGLGGMGLLLVTRALLLGLTVGLTLWLAVGSGSSPRQAALAIVPALPIILAGGALRPQLFALPLFALVLLLGGLYHRRRGAPLAVALAVGLWANLHGSFVLAPVALALLAAGALRPSRFEPGRAPLFVDRPEAAARLRLTVVAALAALANPWGVGIYQSALQVALANGGGGLRGIAGEWKPLDPTSFWGLLFVVVSLCAALGAVRSPSSRAWIPLALGLGALGLSGARHITWFAVAAMPLAALALPRLASAAPGRPGLNAFLLASLTALAVAGLLQPALRPERQLADGTPVALGDLLAESKARRIFAYSDWSGYLAWRLRPEARLFVDNRFEQHPRPIWEQYVAISRAEGDWAAELDTLGVDALALDTVKQAPLIAAARASGGWRELAAADQQLVLLRVAGPAALPRMGSPASAIWPVLSDGREGVWGGPWSALDALKH
jgi:hypothetical protein